MSGLSMRQVCNLVYAVNAEIRTDPGEFDAWERDINRPPPSYFNKRGYRYRVPDTSGIESLMQFAGVGR